MKLKPQTTILLSILFVAAGVLITWGAGLWQMDSDKTPRRLESSGSQPAQYDPADIRGSYTFGEISSLFGIPLADLAAAFELTEAEAVSFQAKSLESHFEDVEAEIGTASVRMFVAYYLGVAYTSSEGSYLTDTAASILKKAGRMTAEQAATLESHLVSVSMP